MDIKSVGATNGNADKTNGWPNDHSPRSVVTAANTHAIKTLNPSRPMTHDGDTAARDHGVMRYPDPAAAKAPQPAVTRSVRQVDGTGNSGSSRCQTNKAPNVAR